MTFFHFTHYSSAQREVKHLIVEIFVHWGEERAQWNGRCWDPGGPLGRRSSSEHVDIFVTEHPAELSFQVWQSVVIVVTVAVAGDVKVPGLAAFPREHLNYNKQTIFFRSI